MPNTPKSTASIVCLLAIALLAPQVLAQDERGTIKGILVDDEKDRPLRGAILHLLDSQFEVKTDFKGTFSLTVPAGVYKGLAIERPKDGGVYTIEAELVVSASVEDDLGEIGVPMGVAASSEPALTEPEPEEASPPPPVKEQQPVAVPDPAPQQETVSEPVPVSVEPIQPVPVLVPEPVAEPVPDADTAPVPPPEAALTQEGEVKPWLGIVMSDWSLEHEKEAPPSDETVIKVLKVFKESPARKAGFREGDVLISMDGARVGNVPAFRDRLAEYPAGQKARFLLLREGKFVETEVLFEAVPESVLESLNQPGKPQEVLESLSSPPQQAPPGLPIPEQPPFQRITPQQEPASAPPQEASPAAPALEQPSFQRITPQQGPASAPPQEAPPAAPVLQKPSFQRLTPQQPGPPPGTNAVPGSPVSNTVPPPAPQVHPLIQEARDLASQEKFVLASRKYDEYTLQHPQDGWAMAEHAEMVYFGIQKARGLALMAQAVKKPSLPVPERTRLRLIIAHSRLESGNLITAKQILLEARRDDPGNPFVEDLLYRIAVIEAQIREQAMRGQRGPAYDPTLEQELLRLIMEEILD